MDTRPPIAHSYTRFSTPQQGDDDRSSSYRQGESAEEWSCRTGIPLSGLRYEELGKSGQGAHLKGALGRFLQKLRGHDPRIQPGDYLIIEDIDRLTRQQRLDALDLCREICQAGMTIVTLDDHVRGEPWTYTHDALQDESGVLTHLTERIDAARYYVERLSRLVGGAWAKKRKATIEEGKAIRQASPGWVDWDPETKSYLPNRHAATVAKIWALAKDHAITPIARMLNEENKAAREAGEPAPWPLFGRGIDATKRDAQRTAADLAKRQAVRERMIAVGWTADRVSKILRAETVTGWTQVGVMVDGKSASQERVKMYPVVVEWDDYVEVCEIRTGRKKVDADKSDGYRNLYPRLSFCARCKRPMMTHWQSGRSYGYYICRSRRRGGGCDDGPTWRLDALDALILSGLEWAVGLDATLIPATSQDGEGVTKALRSRRGELTALMERQAARMAMDDMPDAAVVEIGRRYAATQADLDQVERELVTAEREQSRRKAARRDRERSLKAALDLREMQGHPEGRRRLRSAIRAVVDRIEVDLDRVTIHLADGVILRSMTIPSATVEKVGPGQYRRIEMPDQVSWSVVGLDEAEEVEA